MSPLERQPMYSSTITTPEGSLSDTDTGGVIAVPEKETTASTTTYRHHGRCSVCPLVWLRVAC
jgi:hypothetical protein